MLTSNKFFILLITQHVLEFSSLNEFVNAVLSYLLMSVLTVMTHTVPSWREPRA